MNDSADLPPEPKKSIFKFSIAEVFVMITVITLLVMLVLPIINSYLYRYDKGHLRIYSLNRLRNIGLAVVNYSASHDSNMPLDTTTDLQGKPLHGWMTTLIPFLDEIELANQINYEKSWKDSENQTVFTTSLPFFLNPAIRDLSTNSEGYALTHYTANSRVIGIQKSYSLDEISNADGMATTILVGEINGNFPAWGSTSNFRDPVQGLKGGPEQFGSPFKAVNVIFADGSGKCLSKDIDPQILKALSTPDGGERVSRDDY
ncbi:DUF1559 domain-containing protein [Gimesia aquarii]|uniref:DUF1559 domain-containing protein n=1 Tax=Gimesia aquarii TaxID=2527964 RepID=A0A517WVL4_9PLAN|nr:DUF1559 domain-containing protein [Gimesia aquarii]QDU09268.1 hypothetical protein V202x_26410 [Gimesia aquarii]